MPPKRPRQETNRSMTSSSSVRSRILPASPLRTLADSCVAQPLSEPVPHDTAYRARKGTLKLAFRAVRQRVVFGLAGQGASLHSRIEKSWRRTLWIHEGMPYIGDALMDLAPRSLLAEHGLVIDLFAPPNIAGVFKGDAWFRRVTDEPGQLQVADYDFAIILANSQRATELKRQCLPSLPWVSLHGFYGVPDFHRSRFVTRRLADLGGWTLANGAMAQHSAQKLVVDESARRWAAQAAPPNAVALAIGGREQVRTYHRWAELVAHIHSQGIRDILLVGSDNGRAEAERLLAAPPAGCEILNFVAAATLHETQALLQRAGAAICADGGLMHLALTTGTPVVGLFSSSIDPEWRMPVDPRAIALRSVKESVDGIDPADIGAAIGFLMAERRREPPR